MGTAPPNAVAGPYSLENGPVPKGVLAYPAPVPANSPLNAAGAAAAAAAALALAREVLERPQEIRIVEPPSN